MFIIIAYTYTLDGVPYGDIETFYGSDNEIRELRDNLPDSTYAGISISIVYEGSSQNEAEISIKNFPRGEGNLAI